MFSNFFSSPAKQTRFESTKALQDLVPLIKELQQQEVSLKETAQGKGRDLVYQKSIIMSTLVVQVNKIIEDFNRTAVPETPIVETIAITKLLKALNQVIRQTIDKHSSLLDIERTGVKNLAEDAIKATTFVTAIGVSVATGSIIYGGAALLMGPRVDKRVIKLVGLNDRKTKSMRILIKLIQKLDFMLTVFQSVKKDLIDENPVIESFLNCSITHAKMKTPVLCLLDGRMYEREAIEKWLAEKRTSPFNRQALAEGQEIRDVLVENISLREAVEEFEEMQIEALESKKEEKEESKLPAP